MSYLTVRNHAKQAAALAQQNPSAAIAEIGSALVALAKQLELDHQTVLREIDDLKRRIR